MDGVAISSKRGSTKTEPGHDLLASSMKRGMPTTTRELPKLLGAQVDDVRALLVSLSKLDDLC